MDTLFFITSGLFSIVAYCYYFLKTKKSSIEPNKWSWLIWSTATVVETLTYNELSGDAVKSTLFFISAACCVVIAALIWSKSKWKRPDITEFMCLIASGIALVVWLKFNQTTWAHFIMIGALPIAFIPTYIDAWKDYKKEEVPSWMLWTSGDALALALVCSRFEKGIELPYAITELVCHGIVWLIVINRRKSVC